jgi:hypothetical protein
LREFFESAAYGVAKLLDQIKAFAVRRRFERYNDAGWMLVHNAVDTRLAILPFNHVLAHARPLVSVDLAAADRLDDAIAQAFFSVSQ